MAGVQPNGDMIGASWRKTMFQPGGKCMQMPFSAGKPGSAKPQDVDQNIHGYCSLEDNHPKKHQNLQAQPHIFPFYG